MGDDVVEVVGELAAAGLGDKFIVEEVELEGVGGEEVGAVGGALAHGAHVRRVEGGGEDSVLVGEAREEVAGARGAVPHVVLLLPALAEVRCEVALGELYPLPRGEEGALALADVLGHEEVAAGDDPLLRLGQGRALVAGPEGLVGGSIPDGDDGVEEGAEVLPGDAVAPVLKGDEEARACGHIVGDVHGVPVVHEEVGEEEVAVEDAVGAQGGPVDIDAGLDGVEPAEVDGVEAVAVDGDAGGGGGGGERAGDEGAEGGGVGLEVEGGGAGGEGGLNAGAHRLELPGGVVAGGGVPVEVVEGEDVGDGGPGHEGDFAAVEGGEPGGGKDAGEGAGAAEGEDELDEGGGEVVVAGFGLGPEEGDPLAGALGLGVEGEVDVAGDDGVVEFMEPVLSDPCLEFLLGDILVLHAACHWIVQRYVF